MIFHADCFPLEAGGAHFTLFWFRVLGTCLRVSGARLFCNALRNISNALILMECASAFHEKRVFFCSAHAHSITICSSKDHHKRGCSCFQDVSHVFWRQRIQEKTTTQRSDCAHRYLKYFTVHIF